jgi:hypothetical protein
MPYLDVYIGRLSDGADPLDWGGDPSIGNTPKSISPAFPPNYGRAHSQLLNKIKWSIRRQAG